MNLEEKVGQALCLGWSECRGGNATALNAHACALLGELHAGGVVLLRRNLGNPGEVRSLTAALQARSASPLLINIDQEGGLINRLGPPFHQFPGNMALGAIAAGSRRDSGPPPIRDDRGEADSAAPSRAAELARRQAAAVAAELLAVGINWNCAPVVDVNNNPGNPVIGVRSFGEDPDVVATLGAAAITGYQDAGLLACAKHFPGHGDTSIDSHLALPIVTGDRARLERVELAPFRAAIAAGVGSIMTTHILFPALDPAAPATLSQTVLTGLLRGELGFDGLIATDCLEMSAIAGTVGAARGAVLALVAGADMALICHTLKTQRAAFRAIVDAVRSGELPKARLDEAVERIAAAKARFAPPSAVGREPYRTPGMTYAPHLPLTAGAAADCAPWDAAAHDALEREIAQKAITVVRGLDLPLSRGASILVVEMRDEPSSLAAAISAWCERVSVFHAHPGMNREENARLTALARDASDVVLAIGNPGANAPSPDEQAALARRLALAQPRLVVVALGSPYALSAFGEVRNTMATYSARPCSADALAASLFGEFTPNGELPVTLSAPG